MTCQLDKKIYFKILIKTYNYLTFKSRFMQVSPHILGWGVGGVERIKHSLTKGFLPKRTRTRNLFVKDERVLIPQLLLIVLGLSTFDLIIFLFLFELFIIPVQIIKYNKLNVKQLKCMPYLLYIYLKMLHKLE